jgi:hypothetical protein
VTRLTELCRSRAYFALSEEDCIAWFGVGRATLERFEAGEVEPEPEVLERIDRYLQFCGGQFSLSGPPPLPPSVTHSEGTLAGGASNRPAGPFGGHA